jgi:hypothetical protein
MSEESESALHHTSACALAEQRARSLASAASFFIKASYFVGGLAGLATIVAVGAAILDDKYGDPFKLNVRSVHGWAPAFHWAVITVAAYLILYRLIAGTLARRSLRAFTAAAALREEPGFEQPVNVRG